MFRISEVPTLASSEGQKIRSAKDPESGSSDERMFKRRKVRKGRISEFQRFGSPEVQTSITCAAERKGGNPLAPLVRALAPSRCSSSYEMTQWTPSVFRQGSWRLKEVRMGGRHRLPDRTKWQDPSLLTSIRPRER